MSAMSGIGVVVNPKSRRNLGDPGAAARLARQLGDSGIVREARSIDELHRVAEDFQRADIDVLAISGGDGTNSVTLTGFVRAYGSTPLPPIALLRGGTMNTVANSVGVARGRPEHLLGRLVHRYARRATEPIAVVERDVMHVVSETDRTTRCAFLFGTGIMHRFLAEYYAGGASSPLVAAKVLARGIGSAMVGGPMIQRLAEPFRGSVMVDDGVEWPERDYLAVAAGTVSHIGLDFKPFYRFAERAGAFHCLGIVASPAAFVAELHRIHQARPMRAGKAYDAVASRMVVQSTVQPLRYMIDGDLHETRGRLEVTVGARVRLIVDPGEHKDGFRGAPLAPGKLPS
jgi:diacylglycerol kinase (ATP)